jgi:hypothetical protein
MSSHLRHWHAPRQPQNLGIEIDVALRPARAAMNFEEPALTDQIADRHRLGPQRLRLAAPGLVPVLLDLDQLGEP